MYHLVIVHAHSSTFLTKTVCWCRLFNIGSPLLLFFIFFFKVPFWGMIFYKQINVWHVSVLLCVCPPLMLLENITTNLESWVKNNNMQSPFKCCDILFFP